MFTTRNMPFNIPILPDLVTRRTDSAGRRRLLPAHHWLPSPTSNLAATLVFIVAAITDWFDGYLARRWNQTSAFGAFLDPVADKLMVAGALLVLVQLDRVNAVIAFIIVGREITISALREWMAEIGARKSVAVSSLGKIKTAVQMVAIPMLLFHDPLFVVLDMHIAGEILLWIAGVLTVWSMFYYLRRAWPLIKEKSGAL
jgi:cardiolipin synthase